MISAADSFDIGMVRAYIERHGLDPVSAGSHTVKAGNVRVTAERYSWGRVFYAEDRGHALSLTWVERGNDVPTLPAWVRHVRPLVERPECLGYREADHVCDGGMNPETGEEERPCAWRARCLHVQKLAGKPDSVPSVLAKFTDEDLATAAEGRPKRRKPDPERERRRLQRAKATYADSVQMVHAFVDRVMELGGWKLAPTRWRASAGQFFVREHQRNHGGKAGGNYFVMHRRVIDKTTTVPGAKVRPGAGRMPSIVMMYPHSSEVRFSMQIRSDQFEFIQDVMPAHLQVRHGRYDRSHGGIVSVNRITAEEVEEAASGLVRVIQERKYDSVGAYPAIGTRVSGPWVQWSVLRGKR